MRISDYDGGMKARPPKAVRRRCKRVARAAGLVALLGAAVTSSQWQRNDDSVVPAEVNAADPTSAPIDNPTSPTLVESARMPDSRATSTSPAASSSLSEDDNRRMTEARAAARRNNVPISRPIPRTVAEIPDDAVTVRNVASARGGETLRLVSARADLTGQRELAWVADNGRKVGLARCSQTIKLATDAKPARKPNLLICWRTGTTRSVYTVMVDFDGDPSERESVTLIDATWRQLLD